MLRKLLTPIIFLVLFAFLTGGLNLSPSIGPSRSVDEPLPAFALAGLMGGAPGLTSDDLRGKVSLLNVWASWCVACRSEHPLLLELAAGRDVPIYGLNYKDRREDAVRWLDYYGNPYRLTGFDGKGAAGASLGVYGVPETYVVDRNGVIRYRRVGPLNEDVLAKDILPLVERLQSAAI